MGMTGASKATPARSRRTRRFFTASPAPGRRQPSSVYSSASFTSKSERARHPESEQDLARVPRGEVLVGVADHAGVERDGRARHPLELQAADQLVALIIGARAAGR